MTYPAVITGYHASPAWLLELVADAGVRQLWSTRPREWFGFGVYFFAYSKAHAERWVQIGYQLNWWDGNPPGILKSDIETRNCLWLEEPSCVAEIEQAAIDLKAMCGVAGDDLPKNERRRYGVPVERRLDCAIFELLHFTRMRRGLPAYDTVVGYCASGRPLIPGTTIRLENHVQICVRNHECIKNTELIWKA